MADLGQIANNNDSLKNKRKNALNKKSLTKGGDGSLANVGAVSGQQNSGQQTGKIANKYQDASNLAYPPPPRPTFGDQPGAGQSVQFRPTLDKMSRALDDPMTYVNAVEGIGRGARDVFNTGKDIASDFVGRGSYSDRAVRAVIGDTNAKAEAIGKSITEPTTPEDIAAMRRERYVTSQGGAEGAQSALDQGAIDFDDLGATASMVGDVSKFIPDGKTPKEKAQAYYSNVDATFDDVSSEFNKKGSVSTVSASGDSALFGNMADTDISRANSAYDLYHEGQMRQVAQNDKGLVEMLRYNEANKEIKDLNKQRVRLRHLKASGGINSRRYSEALNNLAMRSEAISQRAAGGPKDKRANSREEMARAATLGAQTGAAAHLEQVRSNREGAEAASAKYLADRADKRRAGDRSYALEQQKLVGEVYGKTAEYGDTIEDVRAGFGLGKKPVKE